MSLGERGEGGTIVLKTILVKLPKRSRQAAFVTLLSFIGISRLMHHAGSEEKPFFMVWGTLSPGTVSGKYLHL